MNSLLKTEELLLALFSGYLFSTLEYDWWWFAALFLAPDISMLGYLFGSRAGAWAYNAAHHKGIAALLFIMGGLVEVEWLQLAGVIMLGHASFDRVLGYGLKYPDSFQHTHLGTIGRATAR